MKEISYLISHYIEAFIIFHYCHSIFKQKKSNFSVFLGFTLCYSILFGIFHFQNIYVNIIASVLAPLFLISYLYDVPKIYAFFHSLILYLSMALGELSGPPCSPYFLIIIGMHGQQISAYYFYLLYYAKHYIFA